MPILASFLGIDSLREVAQSVVTGIVNGSAYGLLGAAFALILGVTGRFHFAFSLTFTLTAYVAAVLVGDSGLPLIPALLIGLLAAAALSVLIEQFVYRPLADRASGDALLPVFVASLGIVIAGTNAIRLIWGPNTRNLEGFPQHAYSVLDVDITLLSLTSVVVAALLIGALAWMLARTTLGGQIRAVRGNPDMAMAVGIHVRRIFLIVFVIGTLMAGVSAGFDGMKYAVDPEMGSEPVFYAFVVAFLAGVDRSPIVIGLVGVLIGVLESLSTLWLSTNLSAITVFGLLFLFLAVRSVPQAVQQLSGSLVRPPRRPARRSGPAA